MKKFIVMMMMKKTMRTTPHCGTNSVYAEGKIMEKIAGGKIGMKPPRTLDHAYLR